MKKAIAIDLKPYGAVFDDQTGRTLTSVDTNGHLKFLFQKGRNKSLICPHEVIDDCTPWNSKDKPLVADSITYTLVNEHQDEDLTFDHIINRTVETVKVYYPNSGNSNLTVTLLMTVPPVKDENGKTIKPKRNDSPITIILTASFNKAKYIF